MKLEGRLALVTGSNRGIGADIALHLAENGADVATNYLVGWSRPKSEQQVVGRHHLSIRARREKPDAFWQE